LQFLTSEEFQKERDGRRLYGGAALDWMTTFGSVLICRFALAANRAWLAPTNMILTGPLEAGLPVHYQIHVIYLGNLGREPALGVVPHAVPIAVPYILPTAPAADPDVVKIDRNTTCDGLDPKPSDGLVIYPPGGTNYWLPSEIADTPDNRQMMTRL
jgi:hypothetical protein